MKKIYCYTLILSTDNIKIFSVLCHESISFCYLTVHFNPLFTFGACQIN